MLHSNCTFTSSSSRGNFSLALLELCRPFDSSPPPSKLQNYKSRNFAVLLNMAPETVSKCQVCDNPATSVCGGCQSATYSHSYCSKACQKQDWLSHKTLCSDLKMERVLIRASTILQAAYLKFRESTWNMPITKVEDGGGQELIIHRDSDNDKDYFLPLPEHLMNTTAIKNQVLCTSMCSESIAWMHETITCLLSGKPTSSPTSPTITDKHCRLKHHHRRTHNHLPLRPVLHHNHQPHRPPPQ